MIELSTYLAENPVFGRLTPEEQAAMRSWGHLRHYVDGAFLAHAGDVWPYLFVVMDGIVDVVKESVDGRRLLPVTLRQGELFWGAAFFIDHSPQPASLQARGDCAITVWSREHLETLLKDNGPALWALCAMMLNRMQMASQIVEELAFQPIASRLARFILEQFESREKDAITRDLTLDDIAARVGTTREVVCRTLYRFSDANLIHITRTEFVLTDRDGLASVADHV